MNKELFLIISWMLIHYTFHAQSVGIGTTTPHASAQLEISSNAKGVLLPRMTSSAIQTILTPAKGLMVYDTTRNELFVNMGTPVQPNWKSIGTNSSWNIGGNAGTNPANQFIGTTDNASLIFRIRNKQSGKIDSVNAHTFLGYKAGMNCAANSFYNTGVGYNALFATTTGNYNTASGAFALFNNTTGIMNSAFGVYALSENTTGNFNVAFGFEALEHNTGFSNSAFGNSTLKWNTTGFANTAIGSGVLALNTTGSLNVAIGRVAMFSNTVGYNNVAAGAESMNKNTTGAYNTALGDASLYSNTFGVGNTACGAGALYGTAQSSYNTAVGYHAGITNSLGWNNTLIGAECNVNDLELSNCVGLGYNATVLANNQARIGNSATTSIGGYTNWTNVSDGRYKKNIREDVRGLDFIMKLRPVTYQLDVTKLSARLNESGDHNDTSGMYLAIAAKESMIQSGFIAQEVEEAAASLGYDFSGVDKPKNKEDLYGLRYAEFVVPLVKAVQELQQYVEELQQQIEELKKSN